MCVFKYGIPGVVTKHNKQRGADRCRAAPIQPKSLQSARQRAAAAACTLNTRTRHNKLAALMPTPAGRSIVKRFFAICAPRRVHFWLGARPLNEWNDVIPNYLVLPSASSEHGEFYSWKLPIKKGTSYIFLFLVIEELRGAWKYYWSTFSFF